MGCGVSKSRGGPPPQAGREAAPQYLDVTLLNTKNDAKMQEAVRFSMKYLKRMSPYAWLRFAPPAKEDIPSVLAHVHRVSMAAARTATLFITRNGTSGAAYRGRVLDILRRHRGGGNNDNESTALFRQVSFVSSNGAQPASAVCLVDMLPVDMPENVMVFLTTMARGSNRPAMCCVKRRA